MWSQIVFNLYEIRTKSMYEKRNIGLQDHIPIPRTNHSASFKVMKECAAMQHGSYPDQQTSTAIKVFIYPCSPCSLHHAKRIHLFAMSAKETSSLLANSPLSWSVFESEILDSRLPEEIFLKLEYALLGWRNRDHLWPSNYWATLPRLCFHGSDILKLLP